MLGFSFIPEYLDKELDSHSDSKFENTSLKR